MEGNKRKIQCIEFRTPTRSVASASARSRGFKVSNYVKDSRRCVAFENLHITLISRLDKKAAYG